MATASVDKLGEAIVKHEARAEELRGKIADIAAREDEALKADVLAEPSKNPFATLTSKSAKLRRSRTDAEKELAGLESLLPRLRAEHARVSREYAEQFLDGQRKKLRALGDKGPAIWAELEAAFAELRGVYEAASETVENDRRAIEAEALSVLEAWGDLRETFLMELSAVATAVPSTFAAALDRLRSGAAVPLHRGPQRIYRSDAGVAEGFGAQELTWTVTEG